MGALERRRLAAVGLDIRSSGSMARRRRVRLPRAIAAPKRAAAPAAAGRRRSEARRRGLQLLQEELQSGKEL
jgi:hypothetical protein